jgi:PLP dependent protein
MYNEILKKVNEYNATLVAVSKTKPMSAIESIYEKGQRHFGENRVQELVDKYEGLPKDIHWHMIGSLQKNKVKYIAPFIYLIHSVDSPELFETIQKEAIKNNRVIDILLQIHIAEEETKQGFESGQVEMFLKNITSTQSSNVNIVGLMGMATFTDNKKIVSKEFKSLKVTFDHLKSQYFNNSPNFQHISMGMSGDYELALAEGSTVVRVGSAIFGNR